MYEMNFVYQDFKTYTVQIEDTELEKFMKCVKQNIEYYDKDKAMGFWLPIENIRCCYIVKRVEKPPITTEATIVDMPLTDEGTGIVENEEQKCI